MATYVFTWNPRKFDWVGVDRDRAGRKGQAERATQLFIWGPARFGTLRFVRSQRRIDPRRNRLSDERTPLDVIAVGSLAEAVGFYTEELVTAAWQKRALPPLTGLEEQRTGLQKPSVRNAGLLSAAPPGARETEQERGRQFCAHLRVRRSELRLTA
jgi:hypothetical protein